jgi:hypothetical protein
MTNCSCNTQPSHNLAAYIYIYILILEHGQRTSLSTVSWWLATFPDQGPVDGKPTPTAHAEVICAGGLLQACDLWQGFPGVNHPLAATVSCKILKRHALDASQQVGQNRARAAISCVGASVPSVCRCIFMDGTGDTLRFVLQPRIVRLFNCFYHGYAYDGSRLTSQQRHPFTSRNCHRRLLSPRLRTSADTTCKVNSTRLEFVPATTPYQVHTKPVYSFCSTNSVQIVGLEIPAIRQAYQWAELKYSYQTPHFPFRCGSSIGPQMWLDMRLLCTLTEDLHYASKDHSLDF